MISVAPGRRPKLTTNGEDYTFAQERELMRDKIRTALRLAAAWGHRDIVVGPFGFGPGFRNPARQVSAMWKDVLYEEDEFQDAFENVVFAIESVVVSSSSSSSSTSTSSGGSATTPPEGNNNTNSCELSDYEIFKEEFEPKKLCKISYCKT